MDKRHILDEIKRLSHAHGDKPPGSMVFERKTGIKKSDWYPHLWLRWGDALMEAGYAPNKFQTAINDEVVIQKYIGLIKELQRLPVGGEIRRKSKTDQSFPSHSVFDRLGGKKKLLEAVVRYCKEHPSHDHESIITLCVENLEHKTEENQSTQSKVVTGYVYLMKSGRYYKIGRTNSVGRREREFAIQIPVPPKTIHHFETDDPSGVEAYWHKRFSDKRRDTSEWFDLSSEDVRAFKRWKSIV